MSGNLYAVRYGKELQTSDPQIVDEYRAGSTLPKLVEDFELVTRFNLILNQVVSAISIPYFALVGNRYEKLGELYDGLLSPEEAREIGAKHKLDGQIANGFRLRERGLGIFGLSYEQRAATSFKNGKATQEHGKGIFGLTTKQKIAMGQVAAADRGYVIHLDDEIILAYLLLEVPQLRYPNGRRKLSEMKDLVNQALHGGNPVRNENTLKSLWRRKKGIMEEASEEEIQRVRKQYLDDILEVS